MLFQWAYPMQEYRGHVLSFDGSYCNVMCRSEFGRWTFYFPISEDEMRRRGWYLVCPD